MIIFLFIQLVKPSDIQGTVDMLFPENQEFGFLDMIHYVTDQVMEKAGKYDPSGYFLIELVRIKNHGDFYSSTMFCDLELNILR
ncbi:hypothetical protein DY000_02033331 [Brassica cretica]|uniref:Uncharacterized protein n=1 Tax=Brassica cretica TaxID=69181 RepID=A0ABQ7DNK5_BRACR|nr:hypothetical protein DY000_02033331 [Brassica cretica]